MSFNIVGCCWWWLMVLFIQTSCHVGVAGKCEMNKHVFTNKTGEIHNGPAADSPCEWLIQGGAGETIKLKFNLSDSSLGFDHFFVHDGNSLKSTLLASATGTQENVVLLSSGPSVYLILHSDGNDSRQSLGLVYSIVNCSSNNHTANDSEHNTNGLCSNRQHCNQQCHSCNNNSNQSVADGACKLSNVKCKDKMYGEKCSIAELPNIGLNTWYLVTDHSLWFGQRAGHVSGYVSSVNKLFVHGGHSLIKNHDDFIAFDFKANEWRSVEPVGTKPPSLYNHAGVVFNNLFIIFGGEHLDSKQLSNELWIYDVNSNSWQLQPSTGDVPSIAGHTLTVVDSTLYVIGGRLNGDKYFSDIIAFKIQSKIWFVVKPAHGKPSSLRLYGHSACCYPPMESIVVFGGFHSSSSLSYAVNTNEVRVYNVKENIWSTIGPGVGGRKNNVVPPPTSFHTAAIVGDYMVIHGGWNDQAKKYALSNTVHYYNLGCHVWTKEHTLTGQFWGDKNDPDGVKNKLVFSHSVVLKDHQTLILSGGFNHIGTVGHVVALRVPQIVVRISDLTGRVEGSKSCFSYDATHCQRDPCCAVCANGCYSARDVAPMNCNNFPKPACSVFSSCESCAAQTDCQWCALNNACYDIQNARAACQSIQTGWWGSQLETPIATPTGCELDDRPPGLTLVEYLQPKGNRYPVKVRIVDKIEWSEGPRDVVHEMFWLGRIYPYTGENDVNVKYTLELRGAGVMVWLNISVQNRDPTTGTVTKLDFSEDPKRTEEDRRDKPFEHLRLFPVRKGDERNQTNLWYNFAMVGTVKYENGASLELYRKRNENWNIIKRELLEPYRTNNCLQYHSCMTCITDAACGWCSATNLCTHIPSVGNGVLCRDNSDGPLYLQRRQEQCTVCEDHLDCGDCVKDKLCTWSSTHACVQRSGNDFVGKCNTSCSSRKTVELCVSGDGCIWCTGRKTCISTNQFVMLNQFGQCGVFLRSAPEKCAESTTCDTCLKKFSCGWLHNTIDPRNGSCLPGDYSGNWNDLSNVHTGLTSWDYDKCTDVDECALGIAQCQSHSTCVNRWDAVRYDCQCDQGYEGDGKISCNKTCWPPCDEHGTCIANYTCVCDLGWKGEICSIDCGCNGHSTCVNQVGVCDRCQDFTTGLHCQFCVNGSYGNATTSAGCKECQCNGHGDASRNLCDAISGRCFCTNNTDGHNCERCRNGFSGDPKTGICVLSCQRSSILKNANSGFVAPYNGDKISASFSPCLWTIAAFNAAHEELIYHQSGTLSNSSILFTIRKLSISCYSSYLKIYDSVPPNPRYSSNAFSSSPFELLGTVCGKVFEHQPLRFRAKSGILTLVYYGPIFKAPLQRRTNILGDGFIAEYTVLRCPELCPPPFFCSKINGLCACPNGFQGATCDKAICANGCNSAKNQGKCDQNIGQCMCSIGFTGVDCGTRVNNNSNTTNDFFVSNHVTSFNQSRKLATTPTRAYVSYESTMEHYKGRLYIFGNSDVGSSTSGGTSIEDYFHVYDLDVGVWRTSKMDEKNAPRNRRLHCSFVYQEKMFIYGGLTKNGVSDELWAFVFLSQKWVQFNLKGVNRAVAGHSCTRVGQEVYVIGGFVEKGQLSENVHVVNLQDMAQSSKNMVNALAIVGVYSHVTVHDAETNFVYIHGGFAYHSGKMGVSSQMYALHIENGTGALYWYHLSTYPMDQAPTLIGHVAHLHDDVIYIVGGYNKQEGYNEELYTWKVKCNRWSKLRKDDTNWRGNGRTNRMFSSATSVNGSLYMFGGLNDEVIPSLSMFTPPSGDCWGKVCSGSENRNNSVQACSTFKSCGSCVSRYTKNRCQWCACSKSNPNSGQCIPKDERATTKCPQDCLRTNLISDNYMHGTCASSACTHCRGDNGGKECFWTNLFTVQAGGNRILTNRSDVSYYCEDYKLVDVSLKSLSIPLEEKYRKAFNEQAGRVCPQECSAYKTCGQCVGNIGINAGFNGCLWSEKRTECFSAILIPGKCANGLCGQLYGNETKAKCPAVGDACSRRKMCMSCIAVEECGWCAEDDQGSGTCMAGDNLKSFRKTCGVSKASSNAQLSRQLSWTYSECLLENECLNGNSNCKENEICRDVDRGFVCDCKRGYRRTQGESECLPHCASGCNKGTCVKPAQCQCFFGYTGVTCNVSCDCNGHSNCISASAIDNCVECQNNTRGRYCQKCLPLFVGDPTNHGQCEPCRSVCNGNTEYCMLKSERDSLLDRLKGEDFDIKAEVANLKNGPQYEKDTACLLCGNHSKGEKCEKCNTGYFPGGNGTCGKCQCNGHGTVCDADTGLNCQCQQNTVSDQTCTTDCYKQQCSKCIENYVGDPRNGKPCFKIIDTSVPEIVALSVGETSFFSADVLKSNVNVRIFVDAIVGDFEVYIAVSSQRFNIKSNETSTVFRLSLEEEEGEEEKREDSAGSQQQQKRHYQRQKQQLQQQQRRKKRNTQSEFLYMVDAAKDLFTFAQYGGGVLLISRVRKRVVITMNWNQYDLQATKRFYVALKPTNDTIIGTHKARVYYRQDVPQLDALSLSLVLIVVLFVFVSTFLMYRKLRIPDPPVEPIIMMRSRPSATFNLLFRSLPNSLDAALPRLHNVSRSVYHPRLNQKRVSPVAVQYTQDERAAVITVFVQFPSNEISRWHFGLGSGMGRSMNNSPQLLPRTTTRSRPRGRLASVHPYRETHHL